MRTRQKRIRRSRQLPQRLRPLAALADLANLIDDDEIKRFRNAERLLLEAFGELSVLRIPHALRRTDKSVAELTAQRDAAAKESQSILARFSRGLRAHPYAVAVLLEHMRLTPFIRTEEAQASNLFDTVATVRAVLLELIFGLAFGADAVRLPDECYRPAAVLRQIEGKIRLVVAPVSHWLLPLVEGIEYARLGLCESCKRLYVARRRDQLGCSRKCGDVLYMRRYRSPRYRNAKKRTANSVRSARHRMTQSNRHSRLTR